MRFTSDFGPQRGSTLYPGPAVLFSICTLVGCLSFLQHRYEMIRLGIHSSFSPDIFIWLACLYPWVLLAPFVFRLGNKFPLTGKRCTPHLLVLAAGSIAGALVAAYATALLVTGIERLNGKSWSLPSVSQAFLDGEFAVQQFFYWLIVLNGIGLRFVSRVNEQVRDRDRLVLEKSQLEASLHEAQLEMLRMRLNPHFLFNTLQNISMLTMREPRTASQMLTRLGDLLRAAYRRDYQAEVPLATELHLVRAYVDVERMRFGDRLSIVMEMGPGTENALVPTFLLQPLVENAIVHGLRRMPRTGNIRIASVREESRLILSVTDNGIGVAGERGPGLQMGIGLGSVAERLVRMYPDSHGLQITSLEQGGTEVRAVLPLKLKQEVA